MIDVAIGESEGNGGDVQRAGNDLALVYGRENLVYLRLFGGNPEEDTPVLDTVGREAQDFWANSLLFRSRPELQYNSRTERALKLNALSSAGRARIENAVKEDLKPISDLGAEVTVAVTLPALNTVQIKVKTIYPDGEKRLTIVTFSKRTGDGDFYPVDFNDDFF